MIYLTDKLAVTADSECYMAGKPRQRAGKGVSVDNPRYYPTLAQAVRGAVSTTLRQKVAASEITTPRQISAEKSRIITRAPINPNSSHTMAKIKSFCGSGSQRYFCRDCPSPTPNS